MLLLDAARPLPSRRAVTPGDAGEQLSQGSGASWL